MNKYSIYALLVAAFLFSVFIPSCAMHSRATVETGGSGEVHFDVTVYPFLVDTMREMAAFAGEQGNLPEGRLFDVAQIRRDFAEKETVTLHEIDTPKPEELTGSFSFRDIGVLFQKEKELTEAGIVTYRKQPDRNVLILHLDKNNFSKVATLFPIVDSPLFEMFGPQEGEYITEEEYYEMIALAFGEEGAEALKVSNIELTVNVDGRIIRQTGGAVKGNTVVFTIPLIKVLLLNQPLDYSIVFK